LKLRAAKPKSSHYPKELNTLGDHIRQRRLDLGLFQKQVAEQIGVDKTTVSNWECHESSPQVHDMPAIIRFLGYNPVATTEFFSGEAGLGSQGSGAEPESHGRNVGH